MSQTLTDTRPEAEAVRIKLLRNLPPWRKFEIISQLYTQMKNLTIAGLRQRFPNADDAEIHRRMADIFLGPDLALDVYGPLSENAPPTIFGRE